MSIVQFDIILWGDGIMKTRLYYLRLEKGYSQLKVQMDTGINQSNYSKFERGDRDPTYQQLKILARYFNTSVDYIMELTDVKEPYPPK